MARIIEGDQGEAGGTDPRREIRCLGGEGLSQLAPYESYSEWRDDDKRERVGVQIGERVRISRKPNRRDPYADPINPPNERKEKPQHRERKPRTTTGDRRELQSIDANPT